MAAVAAAAAAALSAAWLLLGLSCCESSYISYNTSRGIVPGKINVHLVPHTHDDVGWLKTVDQYYVGANNSIRGACVQNVLDSLIPALLADENRKFVYVEMAFFQRWWREQSKKMQAIVKELVRSGQLDFINGGMCMHDEASTHYIDMIDQTTLGHQFIKQEFDHTPRIGWQIDPFGHSAVQAYLLGAEVGFDALFFARIDYQDRARRKEQKTLEVIWHGSKSLGSSSQIFTGIFPVHYEPPPGFSFEVNDISPVVQDDETLYDYNVEERVNDFVNAAVTQANVTRTNHIMWTMGTDFRYQYANSWFRQMDKLIHYVNKDGRVNALYSTPSIYTDAKFTSNDSWPLKMEDFFPYADRPNAYWTGYFTSRPGLKGFVRELSGYYLAARQLEFLIGKNALASTTDALADALAIAQHHDAVSGTERQHVADDYAKRLYTGYKEAASLVKFSLACLTESKLDVGCHNITTMLQQCPLMNLSYCPASEITLSRGKSLVVVVYNPLGWNREDIIRIPVVDEAVNIADSEGKLIESQLIPIKKESVRLRNFYVNAYLGVSPNSIPKFWLVFPATVPPLGFRTYFVTKAETTGSKSTISKLHSVCSNESDFLEIGHGNIKLKYEVNKGKLIQYMDNKNSVNLSVEQSYSYYTGDDGSGYNPQASGAYIFRPNMSVIIEPPKEVPLNVLRGPIVDELHQAINPWISQITRVYTKKDHVEFDFTIGPIPIDDEIGKEIITQITTGMETNGTIYTDSNGRDFIKRIRNYRSDWDLQVSQPIAGNYYPVNLGIYMEDNRTELSVLVDRAVGGGSIVDGQIELMLHRRLLHDDSRGVGEVLNETVCALSKCEGLTVKGKFYLRIDRPGEGAEWRRRMGQEVYSPFLLAFSVQEEGHWMDNHVPHFSAMDSAYSLPPNVAILTLQELHGGTVLLRLAHLYEIGEDEILSAMTTVEMKRLFPSKKISKVVEMNLSANQERTEMQKRRLIWKVENPPSEKPAVRGGAVDPSKLIVELVPMEIRTFLVSFEYIFLPRGV